MQRVMRAVLIVLTITHVIIKIQYVYHAYQHLSQIITDVTFHQEGRDLENTKLERYVRQVEDLRDLMRKTRQIVENKHNLTFAERLHVKNIIELLADIPEVHGFLWNAVWHNSTSKEADSRTFQQEILDLSMLLQNLLDSSMLEQEKQQSVVIVVVGKNNGSSSSNI